MQQKITMLIVNRTGLKAVLATTVELVPELQERLELVQLVNYLESAMPTLRSSDKSKCTGVYVYPTKNSGVLRIEMEYANRNSWYHCYIPEWITPAALPIEF